MRIGISSVIALLMLVGCSSLTLEEQRDAAERTLSWLDSRYGIVDDADLRRLMARVTDRVASGVYRAALETKLHRDDAEEFRQLAWRTEVINSDLPNAFSLGGGLIVVTVGMIRETRSEAELAAVIAHEISHQVLGHTEKALLARLDSPTASPGVSYSLDEEIAADSLSVSLLVVARYDLEHAAQALAIGYRPIQGGVAVPPKEWLVRRMAHLHQAMDQVDERRKGSIVSTREFTRQRRRIPRGSSG